MLKIMVVALILLSGCCTTQQLRTPFPTPSSELMQRPKPANQLLETLPNRPEGYDPKETAKVVAKNYKITHELAIQLDQLIDWIEKQIAKNPK